MGKILPSSYTSNQTGAIATLLAGALYGLLSIGATIMIGPQAPQALTVFAILDLIAWILIPFYIKRIKVALIVGMIVAVIALVGFTANPGTPHPWYTFHSATVLVYDFSIVVFYLVLLAFIYFSYKSYKEIK